MKVNIDEEFYKRIKELTDSQEEDTAEEVVKNALSGYLGFVLRDQIKEEKKLRAKIKVNEVIRDNGTPEEREGAERRIKEYHNEVADIQARIPQDFEDLIRSSASIAKVSKEKMTRYLLYTGLRQFTEDIFGEDLANKNSALMYVSKIDELLAMKPYKYNAGGNPEPTSEEIERTIKDMNE